MKKKILATILFVAMMLTLSPTSALAIENKDFETMKQQVSDTYGIPIEIVDTLSETKIRNLYTTIAENQVVSSEEQFFHFTVDEDGNSSVSQESEQAFLDYASSPVAMDDNPVTKVHEDGWMKIYLIIIDKGDTLDISTTYTWLIQPRVTYGQQDLLTLKWENGSYIPNSANGFYSYNINGITNHSEDLLSSGFKRPSEDLKSINYAHPMNDSGARRNEFFHMMVTIEKNTGLSRETAHSAYGHQYKTLNFNLGTALGAAGGVASCFFLPPPYNAICMTAAAAGILGQTTVVYDTFAVEATGKF